MSISKVTSLPNGTSPATDAAARKPVVKGDLLTQQAAQTAIKKAVTTPPVDRSCWERFKECVKAIPVIGHLVKAIAWIIRKIAAWIFGDPVAQMRTVQNELLARLSPNSIKKTPVDSDTVQQYSDYMEHYKKLLKQGSIPAQDPAHQKILSSWPVLRNVAGFVNLGNTCWMNSALQAIFGVDEIRKRINAGPQPRIEIESDEDWAARKEKLEKDRPVPRPAESDNEFMQRLAQLELGYPVPRSDKVEKMLFNTATALFKRGLIREAPKLRKAETPEEFKKRVEKGLVKKLSLQGASQDERSYKKYLNGLEDRFLKAAGVSTSRGAYAIAPRAAETRGEFAARQKRFDNDLERRMESESDYAQRVQLHQALGEVLRIWETGDLPLNDALEALITAIVESNYSSDFRESNLSSQNDSAAFLRIVMNVLDCSFISAASKQLNNAEEPVQMPPDKVFDIRVPLRGNGAEEIEDAEELIKAVFAERANTNPKDKWRGSSDYKTSYKLKSIPTILPIHFFRKDSFAPPNDPELIEEVREFVKGHLPEIVKTIGSTPSKKRVKELTDAFVKKLMEPEDLKIDRPVTFESLEIDLTDIFDVDEGADSVKYRVKSFTVHLGGYDSGHYVAYRPGSDGKWYCYSDTEVTLVNAKQFQDALSQAYNVLLERV